MTVGLQNLSNQNFYGVKSIVPPIKEQIDIVAHVEAASRQIQNGLRRARNEIELLREYRTRLVADIVTGRLDVRQAAACLPAEMSEEEPDLDEAQKDIEDDGDSLDDEAAE